MIVMITPTKPRRAAMAVWKGLTYCNHSVGVDGPRRHQACQNEVAVDLRQRRPSVEQISRIGMDTSKYIFQLHGVNTAEQPVLRKKLRRKEMFAFVEKLQPMVIAIEACGARRSALRGDESTDDALRAGEDG